MTEPVTGDYAELRRAYQKLGYVAAGKAAEALRQELRTRALELALASWSTRASPSGRAWRGGASLYRSGAMRSALMAQWRPGGFALLDKVQAKSGALYGGTHQYGRTIRAKGEKPMRFMTPVGWRAAHKVRIPARPVVPKKGELPATWARAFEAAATQVLEKISK
jgi:hypothetical protein